MKSTDSIYFRESVIDSVRKFFKERKFTEIETPLLVPAPDPSPYNEIFETSPIFKKPGFLAPSPEFFMKKLLSLGSGNIFQICKAFRNPTELDPLHNPEFTILEWYRVGADYTDLMGNCENLINYLRLKVQRCKGANHGPEDIRPSSVEVLRSREIQRRTIKYQGLQIDISSPWTRISVKEAFKKYAGINLDKFLDFKIAKKIALKKGYKIEKNTTWEQIYHQIFLNEIEPKLPKEKPVILYDYPAPLAALARLKKNYPRYAERFEFYIGGLELGNGYSELTDWREQEKRLKNDLKERKRLGMKVFPYDRDFIEALKTMPKTSGIAVGVDRLIMLFTDSKTIQEVIPFPATEIFK